MIKCEICNKSFLRINSFHLKTHGIKLEDCKYPIQFHNFERDIKKTKIAENKGFILKRIRV
jgi:hypothetical protein